MENDYDVVVVGAGPSGLSAAKAVAEMGLRCLVIEKNKEVGYPVRTSGASWIGEMKELGIPERYLHPIYKVSIIAPQEEVSISFDEPVPCILDVTGVYKFLASQAQQHGAELLLEREVRDVIIDGGFVRGVELKSDSGWERYLCKVVVDASGFNALLVRKLGILKEWSRTAIGVQYDIESSKVDSRHVMLLVGEKAAPSGYGWVFPWKRDRVRVGVGLIRPDTDANPDQLAGDLLKSKYLSELRSDCRIVEKQTGAFPCSGPIDTTTANGFIAIGDAAGLGSPLHGEGIRYAIRFGMIAGDIICRAIQNDNLSKGSLGLYEKMWRKMEERNFRIALSIQKKIASSTDEQWNKGVRYLRQLAQKSPELLIEIFKTNFSYMNIWRVFKQSPLKAIRILLKNM